MKNRLKLLHLYLKKEGLSESSEVYWMYKSAGLMVPPPNMVRNVKKWMKQKIAGGLLTYLEKRFMMQGKDIPAIKIYPKSYEKLKSMTNHRNNAFVEKVSRVEGYTKVDLNDWRYATDEDRQLLRDKGHRKLYIRLDPRGRERGYAGGYSDFSGLVISPTNPFKYGEVKTDDEMLNYLDEYFAKINDTIEHELIHYGQRTLSKIKEETLNTRMDYFLGKPPKNIQTKEEDFPEGDSENERIQREHLKAPEFYTHLNSNINAAERSWHGLYPDGGTEVQLKRFISRYISDAVFFNTLKNFNQPLYKKAISLFYQEMSRRIEVVSGDSLFDPAELSIGDKVKVSGDRYNGVRGVVSQIKDDKYFLTTNILGREVTIGPIEKSSLIRI